MRTWLVALAALSWLANAAAADSGPPGLAAPSAAPSAAPTAAPGATLPAPEPPSALDDAAQYPASDRGALFENAITVPQGQAEVNLRATVGVAALDLRFGVTSTTELSVEVGMAASSPSTVPEIAVGIKQVLVRGRRFRLAVDGSLRNVFYNPNVEEPACCGAGIGDDSVQSQSIQIGGIGAVATGCVDSRCFFRVSMGGQVWVAFGDNGGTVERVVRRELAARGCGSRPRASSASPAAATAPGRSSHRPARRLAPPLARGRRGNRRQLRQRRLHDAAVLGITGRL